MRFVCFVRQEAPACRERQGYPEITAHLEDLDQQGQWDHQERPVDQVSDSIHHAHTYKGIANQNQK